MFRAQQPARANQANNENHQKSRDQTYRGICHHPLTRRTSGGNARDVWHFRFESFGFGLVRHTDPRAKKIPTSPHRQGWVTAGTAEKWAIRAHCRARSMAEQQRE